MLQCDREDRRELKTVALDADLVVVGGGIAGVCAAVTAAREGTRVVLIQDRPVLGGNASSEVRLWILGATSHMGNNNRWSREGGVIDEVLTENTYRNREGNPVLVDPLLLELVDREPNITLLLNTAVHEVEKSGPDTIARVRAFCSQNSTCYDVSAPLFCDASGDGVVAFLAGAAFRMGAETAEEFGEGLAPTKDYGELLGHSIYFYTKDVGRPVKFVPPSFALDDISRIPRFRTFNTRTHGCELWWIEYGGRLDTVHQTEEIKWELWRVIYGVWNHIKNSGEYPDAATKTLEWVGMIPGKRESRRFEGDYMMRQRDIVEQRTYDDAVSFGGWALDLHPADGVFSERPGCNQWHSKGVYQVPYRSMYSRNITNLFLAGRILSVSHVAFGSTRVMATCGHNAQAVGMAADLCRRGGLRPRDLLEPGRMCELQRRLLRRGQFIPGVKLEDPEDLAASASVEASTEITLGELPGGAAWRALDRPWAMVLPLGAGRVPTLTLQARAPRATQLSAELRVCSRRGYYTPDTVVARVTAPVTPVAIRAGRPAAVAVGSSAAAGAAPADTPGYANAEAGADTARVVLDFKHSVDQGQYAFVCLMPQPGVELRLSDRLVTGVLTVSRNRNHRVATDDAQNGAEEFGVESFEFWTPERRPKGQHFAAHIDPPLAGFDAQQAVNGFQRPWLGPNAWVADRDDPSPSLTLTWDRPQQIGRIELHFDTDFDHAMESVLKGHPDDVMPFCVRSFRIRDAAGRIVHEEHDNHQACRHIALASPVTTDRLTLEIEHPLPHVPAALFAVRCYR